jgi:hypothetical protein
MSKPKQRKAYFEESIADKDVPDLHTPAMIINSLMFGFTVQVLVSQDAESLALSDFLWSKQCTIVPGPPCISPSFSILNQGNKTLGLVVDTLLISLFAMLMRYVLSVSRVEMTPRGFLARALYALDLLAAITVTALTMVNLGMFLQVVATTTMGMFPLYRTTRPIAADAADSVFTDLAVYNTADPYNLLFSPNGTSTVFLLGEISYDWLLYNSSVYIALGAVLAVLSMIPLMVSAYQTRLGLKHQDENEISAAHIAS